MMVMMMMDGDDVHMVGAAFLAATEV